MHVQQLLKETHHHCVLHMDVPSVCIPATFQTGSHMPCMENVFHGILYTMPFIKCDSTGSLDLPEHLSWSKTHKLDDRVCFQPAGTLW